MDVHHAEVTAGRLLASWPDRRLHVQAVAQRADELSAEFAKPDRVLLLAAAWLHDVGYADGVAVTGFHPVDGARFLAREGWEPRLCALVAHHSCAQYEAVERGMQEDLVQWPREDGPVADALVAADMTTGPRGERWTVEERLAEILRRHEPESPVHRAIGKATPVIIAAVRRAEGRVAHPR